MRIKRDYRNSVFAAMAALCVVAPVSAASAQVAKAPEVALLVLSPTPLKRGHALVERRVALKPHDLVLVDDGATEVDLAAAVQVLAGMRAQDGGSVPNDVHAVPTQFTPAPGWRGGRDEAEKKKLVYNLPKAPFRDVEGHGRVRALPIGVPVVHPNPSKKNS